MGSGFSRSSLLLLRCEELLWVVAASLCAPQGCARLGTSVTEEPPTPPHVGQPASLSAGPVLWGTTAHRELLSQFLAHLGPSTMPLVSVTYPTGLSCGDFSGDHSGDRDFSHGFFLWRLQW